MAAAKDIPQTKDVCHAKHRWLKWVAGAIMTLMVAFLTVVGFAWARADAAHEKASEAKTVANVTDTKFDAIIPRIFNGIDRINDRLDKMPGEGN